MKNSFNKLNLFILCVNFSLNVFSQNIAIKTISENILIKNDTSFVREVSVFFKENKETIIYPIFYDTKLENISGIQLYIKKGKRFKLTKNIIISEEDVQLEYITSKRVKSILIPSETEAKITYTVKCRELMYFSDLHFFSNDEIDTLRYQIIVPNKFQFIHNIINKDSLNHLKIDSIKSDNLTKWTIETTPVKVAPDPLMFFRIYKNIKAPLMRTLIIPSSYEGEERKYMNDWYLQKLKARRGLSYNAIHKIDKLTKGVSDPIKILDTLYGYVKNNFKYVAIEIGMGAFIPTHVNEVFTNKEGDCKDLSNFLSEALNYKGIKSDIALAATYDHISDCDFPSLSSANHVICVAYIDDKLVVLDPTDPIHFSGTPVQSIQKRSIFIVNEKGGEFYKPPNFSPQQNEVNYKMELKINSDQMVLDGYFEATYEGISGNFLKRELFYKNNDIANSVIKKHYETVFGNQTISDFKIINADKAVDVKGLISINGKIFKDGNKRLLFFDFLPKLIETVNRETLLEGIHLGSPFSKNVNIKIKMDGSFLKFDKIEHTLSNKGISLVLKISTPSEFVIEFNYNFLFDYFITEKENLNITNEILTSFKEIINEPIILQNKS